MLIKFFVCFFLEKQSSHLEIRNYFKGINSEKKDVKDYAIDFSNLINGKICCLFTNKDRHLIIDELESKRVISKVRSIFVSLSIFRLLKYCSYV